MKAEEDKRKFVLKNLKVKTALYSGKPAEKIDFVLLGDGFVADDLKERKSFETNSDVFIKNLIRSKPFDYIQRLINVHLVYAESYDRGADDEPSRDTKKTIFNSTYKYNNIDRLLVPQNKKNIIKAAKNAPDVDVIIVLVQDERYGGSGDKIYQIPLATYSTGSKSIDIAFHELGHSIADLGDEYADEKVAPNHPLPEGKLDIPKANLTKKSLVKLDNKKTMKRTLKWGHFLEIPGDDKIVGAFEGGYYREKDVYRPQKECKMRKLDSEFCLVCQEEIVKAVYKKLKLKFDDKEYHKNNPIINE